MVFLWTVVLIAVFLTYCGADLYGGSILVEGVNCISSIYLGVATPLPRDPYWVGYATFGPKSSGMAKWFSTDVH